LAANGMSLNVAPMVFHGVDACRVLMMTQEG